MRELSYGERGLHASRGATAGVIAYVSAARFPHAQSWYLSWTLKLKNYFIF